MSAIPRLVKKFYDDNAESWDKTRNHFWTGWRKLWQLVELKNSETGIAILDLGCGNGRFLEFAVTQLQPSTPINYIGVDISPKLLAKAKERAERVKQTHPLLRAEFREEDISQTGRLEAIVNDRHFDLIICIAALHHLGNFSKTRELLSWSARKLNSKGKLGFTTWEIGPELKQRALTGQALASYLSEHAIQLVPGDYILDWRASGTPSYRFAHQFSASETDQLIEASGLKLLADFGADGKNGKLNHYYLLANKS